MPGDATGRLFQFGVFEANEAAGELRKTGVRIKLHSQAFQLLIMLLERPSDVVTREEMRQRLWGEDTFVDFDHGLNTAVNKIREALGDSAAKPRYIETVSGKGYRFMAPVKLRVVVKVPEKESASLAETAGTRPEHAARITASTLLAASHELPAASPIVVRALLLFVQAAYLAFYLGALANLQEIHEIFSEANLLSPAVLLALLVITAAVLIPVRLYIFAAVAFDFAKLPGKFGRIFPILLPLDLLWALSPFLLIHHLSTGLALGMTAALVYLPFAQRALILMYARRRREQSVIEVH